MHNMIKENNYMIKENNYMPLLFFNVFHYPAKKVTP